MVTTTQASSNTPTPPAAKAVSKRVTQKGGSGFRAADAFFKGLGGRVFGEINRGIRRRYLLSCPFCNGSNCLGFIIRDARTRSNFPRIVCNVRGVAASYKRTPGGTYVVQVGDRMSRLRAVHARNRLPQTFAAALKDPLLVMHGILFTRGDALAPYVDSLFAVFKNSSEVVSEARAAGLKEQLVGETLVGGVLVFQAGRYPDSPEGLVMMDSRGHLASMGYAEKCWINYVPPSQGVSAPPKVVSKDLQTCLDVIRRGDDLLVSSCWTPFSTPKTPG